MNIYKVTLRRPNTKGYRAIVCVAATHQLAKTITPTNDPTLWPANRGTTVVEIGRARPSLNPGLILKESVECPPSPPEI